MATESAATDNIPTQSMETDGSTATMTMKTGETSGETDKAAMTKEQMDIINVRKRKLRRTRHRKKADMEKAATEKEMESTMGNSI